MSTNRVLKKAFGNRVVFPPLTLTEDDAVLDVGTGTACWTLDCNAVYTAPHYYGIDISQNLFPTLDNPLQSHIHLTQGNILHLQKGSPWAHRRYTLINQRLLIAAFSAHEWQNVVRNMYEVLAPGGWVQLVETSHCRSGPVTERHRRAVLERVFEKRRLLVDCAERIPGMLRDAGFVDINTEVYEISLGKWAGRDGVEARDNFIGVYRAMKRPVVDEMGIMSSCEFDSLVDEMRKEWDTTLGSNIVFNVFYAQKPASI
ncbi:hypothetical protein F5I97DRAFT_2047573 [Phlebopus sp. FC_14]|nr:hypothetical protein F5I97DRAFT_2047573 [Phlebopus sp. FC_14]